MIGEAADGQLATLFWLRILPVTTFGPHQSFAGFLPGWWESGFLGLGVALAAKGDGMVNTLS